MSGTTYNAYMQKSWNFCF